MEFDFLVSKNQCNKKTQPIVIVDITLIKYRKNIYL